MFGVHLGITCVFALSNIYNSCKYDIILFPNSTFGNSDVMIDVEVVGQLGP